MRDSVNLHFKGPLKILDYYDINYDSKKVTIRDLANDSPIKKTLPGFYVWGHLHGNKFIPYYVGEIHSTGVLERIRQHIISIIKEDSSLTRLSKSYLYGYNNVTPFYKDVLFPSTSEYSDRSNLPKWFSANEDHFKSRIFYLNNREFLVKFKHILEPKLKKSIGYPISNLLNTEKYEDQLLEGIANMHFIWAECNSHINLFEKIEGYLKYSLNGKTFGFSDKLTTILSRLHDANLTISISSDANIPYIFKECPSDIFIGY